MLQDADLNEFNDIVSWLPSGDGFRVFCPQKFEESVAPKYFSMSKWKSFQKQCNLYNFKRVSRGIQKNTYQHPYLQRGRPELLTGIARKKTPNYRALSSSSKSQANSTSKALREYSHPIGASSGASDVSELHVSQSMKEHLEQQLQEIENEISFRQTQGAAFHTIHSASFQRSNWQEDEEQATISLPPPTDVESCHRKESPPFSFLGVSSTTDSFDVLRPGLPVVPDLNNRASIQQWLHSLDFQSEEQQQLNHMDDDIQSEIVRTFLPPVASAQSGREGHYHSAAPRRSPASHQEAQNQRIDELSV